jgi:hypothetical protein
MGRCSPRPSVRFGYLPRPDKIVAQMHKAHNARELKKTAARGRGQKRAAVGLQCLERCPEGLETGLPLQGAGCKA